MNDRSKISIALATFNGEKYLEEQLDSIARQHKRPDELVISDDASTDETVSISTSFAKTAPFPVRVHINPSPLGWRANFFQVAGLCRYSLIAFCDQDDIWHENKLATVLPVFEDKAVLLAHHDALIIDQFGITSGTLRAGENDAHYNCRLQKPTHWSHASGLTLVFDQSLLAFTRYWPGSIDATALDKPAAHDQWIYHLASNLGSIAYIPEPLVSYRQHSANQVGFRTDRRHAFSSPKGLRAEVAAQLKMITKFREALERALLDHSTSFDNELPDAILANRTIERYLTRRHVLYSEHRMINRMRVLASMIRAGSYTRNKPWNLGLRSCLADLRAVVSYPD